MSSLNESKSVNRVDCSYKDKLCSLQTVKSQVSSVDRSTVPFQVSSSSDFGLINPVSSVN